MHVYCTLYSTLTLQYLENGAWLFLTLLFYGFKHKLNYEKLYV